MGMKWAIPVLFSILILGGFGLTQQAVAVPTSVVFSDFPNCDPFLTGPDFGDELGLGPFSGPFPFPPDETINAFPLGPRPAACPSSGEVGTLVGLANLTPTAWHEVFYIADSETVISNFDGFIDGFPAFRIDSPDSFGGCGINCPLVFETLTQDGILEPGETWEFIIDDYANFDPFGSLPAENLGSIGIGSFDSSPSLLTSTGSIFAFEDFGSVGGTALPIDTTALLVAGAYTTASWMIPILVSAVGIGLAVFTLKRSR